MIKLHYKCLNSRSQLGIRLNCQRRNLSFSWAALKPEPISANVSLSTTLNTKHNSARNKYKALANMARSAQELKLLERLFSLLPQSPKLIEQDKYFQKIKETRLVGDVPPPPPLVIDEESANHYVRQLAKLDYQYYPKTLRFIDHTFGELMKTKLLNTDSYNEILNHYARMNNMDMISLVRQNMAINKVDSNIDTFNLIIHYIFRNQNKSNLGLDHSIGNEFFNMKIQKAIPNLSTLYIFYSDFRKFHSKILDKLVELNLPLIHINNRIVRHKFRDSESMDDILKFVKSHEINKGKPVINSIIECYLETGDFEKAWNYMTAEIDSGEFTPNTKTIKLFVSYFCKNRQFYLSESLINYMSGVYGISDKYPMYTLMLELINGHKFEDPNNWCTLTKYFYSRAGKMAHKNLKSLLNKNGKLIDPNFELENSSYSEIQSMNEISENLNWLEEPIWNLESNSPEYITTTVKYFK